MLPASVTASDADVAYHREVPVGKNGRSTNFQGNGVRTWKWWVVTEDKWLRTERRGRVVFDMKLQTAFH